MSNVLPSRRRWIAVSLIAAAGCAQPLPAQDDGGPHPPMGPLPAGFAPCPSERGAASCGEIEVREDHEATAGRRIGLRVKILHGREPSTAPPIYFLAGGPGQAVHDLEPLIVQRFRDRLADRDLVLVDQRGTGGSNPLGCSTGAITDPARTFGPHYTEEELGRCLRELSARADVTQYTTPAFADDLVAVADALGHPTLDVVGGSYGTKAALVLMRRHPERIGVAVLEGVAPPSFLNPLPHARGSQRVMDELFRRCAADPACGAAYPDLAARFDALLEQLERDPARVDVPGVPAPVALERDAFAFLTHVLLFNAGSAAIVPRLVDEVARGEHALLVDLYRQIGTGLVSGIDFGLQLSVTCTENAPAFGGIDLDAATRDTYLGRAMVDGVVEECQRWPAGRVPPGFYDPVTVPVPTLLVTGGLDPATPPEFGEEVHRSLPVSRLVRIGEGAHITAHPCVDGIVADFLTRRSIDALDTACVATIRRPPVQPPTDPTPTSSQAAVASAAAGSTATTGSSPAAPR